jgi:hypothetical protein
MSRITAGSHLDRLDNISPSIIGILINLGAACVVDTDNVTLQVGLQVISQTPIGKLCTIEWVM